MSRQKIIITLSLKDQKFLEQLLSKGTAPARTIRRAQILLNSNRKGKKQYTTEELADLLSTKKQTVSRVLKEFEVSGIECIYRKKRKTPPVESKITGEVEAHVIAMACHNPPEGYCRWTLRLLSERMVQMNYIDKISHTTVGKILKENSLKPHLVEEWCVPKEQSADFAACMEDVLEVYSRPYDETRPVVCMDEKPVQLLAEAREGITSKKTGIRYQDNEYVRNGTCSIFLFTEPLAGWRYTEAKEQRTRIDWAGSIKWLLDEQYPTAEQVILVCDNLNTHNVASLYEAFPPDEALRLAKRLEIHHTPKHGSWLDIAEIELSALGNQCLAKRRISNVKELNEELAAWNTERNASQKGVNWQFTTDDARIKLKHLYPILNF